MGEMMKGNQRAERKVKELQFAQDEDKKNQDRMSELANKLQAKIKTYNQQIEEAEEIAALNLAKFRKAQQELEEAEERSKMAGAALSSVCYVKWANWNQLQLQLFFPSSKKTYVVNVVY